MIWLAWQNIKTMNTLTHPKYAIFGQTEQDRKIAIKRELKLLQYEAEGQANRYTEPRAKHPLPSCETERIHLALQGVLDNWA